MGSADELANESAPRNLFGSCLAGKVDGSVGTVGGLFPRDPPEMQRRRQCQAGCRLCSRETAALAVRAWTLGCCREPLAGKEEGGFSCRAPWKSRRSRGRAHDADPRPHRPAPSVLLLSPAFSPLGFPLSFPPLPFLLFLLTSLLSLSLSLLHSLMPLVTH